MTVVSRLLRTIGYTYALQLGAAAVFVPMQTEVSMGVKAVSRECNNLAY